MGFRDKAHTQELGKGMGINGIGFHFCICDRFQVLCMSEHDGNTKGTQNVTKPVPVTRAFDNGTMRIGPLTKICYHSIPFGLDSRAGNDGPALVDGAHDDEMSVQIDSCIQHKPSCELMKNQLIWFGNQSYEILMTHGRPFRNITQKYGARS